MQNLDIEAPSIEEEKVSTSGRISVSERWENFKKSVLPRSWQRDRTGFSRLEDEDGAQEETAFRPTGKCKMTSVSAELELGLYYRPVSIR